MSNPSQPALLVRDVAKSFTLHMRGGVTRPVVAGAAFAVHPGECVVLGGPSGVGKSSILRMVYGNYGVDYGSIEVRDRNTGALVDLAGASPREILNLRRSSIAYVSQFLRAVPRASALDVAAEAMVMSGRDRAEARRAASLLLRRLNLPNALFDLPPATFSGGEKQRVNIARGFSTSHPVLLLDEPTASLDAENRRIVIEMIGEKLAEGTAILGIFHDEEVRDAVATRILDVSGFSARKAA